MATNNFKPFAQAASANVMSQADYEALGALLTGFQSGKASSAQINKALRQSSAMAYVLAQFISDSANVDVLDNGSTSAILANLKLAMTTLTPGRLLGKRILTTSGTYTPTVGTKSIIVEAIGGGGAGGGSVATTSVQQSSGSGGSSGGYVMASFTSGFSGASFNIGSGGSAAVGANGGGGSTTSFLTINAGGGRGGSVGTASTSAVISGTDGGIASGGDINAIGSFGNSGIVYTATVALGGFGGSSKVYPGSGGVARASVGDGFAAAGYGCGGGGANSGASGISRAGGIGTQGLIIIWEYA